MNAKKHSVLLIDDDESTLFGYERMLMKTGYSVVTATTLQAGRSILGTETFDALVLDLRLPDGNSLEWIPDLKMLFPDLPIIMVTGVGDVPTAVKAMKLGIDNFLTKPVDTDNLEACIQKAIEIGALRKQDRTQRRLTRHHELFFGTSGAARALLQEADAAATGDSVVLILGETGTGKGVLAQRIHDCSERRTAPFVELNCSCLKGDLLRSELFGHAKGSFTTAMADREGLVEVADGGTLFLDEIGDMGTDVQTQFLKTIEEKTFRRIGENRMRKSDFRLVCATNKDLFQETETGAFRKDLYYRICVFPIMVPPLRDRSEDMEGLSRNLLEGLGSPQTGISTEVMELFKGHAWPGNIRELRNVLERAVLLARGAPLAPIHFPGLAMRIGDSAPVAQQVLTIEEAEQEYLKKVVTGCNGDKNKAAIILGVSLATLYRKLGPVVKPVV